MLYLKAFFVAITSGGIGALVAESIQPTLQSSSNGMVLVAGILAGLGTRLACQADRNFSTGVIAAIATVLAISAVSIVTSRRAAVSAERSMAAIPIQVNHGGEPTGSSNSSANEADSVFPSGPVEQVEPTVVGGLDSKPAERPGRKGISDSLVPGASSSFSKLSLLFHGLAALLAFSLGAGPGLTAKDS